MHFKEVETHQDVSTRISELWIKMLPCLITDVMSQSVHPTVDIFISLLVLQFWYVEFQVRLSMLLLDFKEH